MNHDRKNFLLAICMVIFATIMGGVCWLLNYMDVQFAAGFAVGLMLALGCFGIISREFRNLP